jgi:hypothetical protein
MAPTWIYRTRSTIIDTKELTSRVEFGILELHSFEQLDILHRFQKHTKGALHVPYLSDNRHRDGTSIRQPSRSM